MKFTAMLALMCAAGTCAAALPSLSELAERLSSLSERYVEMTNAVAGLRGRLADATGRVHRVVAAIDAQRDSLYTRYHKGHVGQYLVEGAPVTNVAGRIFTPVVKVDLYGDGTAWTNFGQRLSHVTDPEAALKARVRAREVQRAWEEANLPPELAALREAQWQASITQSVTVVVEGN